ncbi:MAG: stage III sporulation protein AF [Clostridia bacterium]|nr:stage III sporulation protein AF [Clostridia bacterium]
MREYLLTLAGVVILSGVITMLGADGGVKKYIRLICSLSVLCALISPLLVWAREGNYSFDAWRDMIENEEIDYDEIYKESLKKHEIKTAENAFKYSISKELSVNISDFDVQFHTVTKNNKEELSSVTITLRDRGVLADPRRMADFVNSSLGCPCMILYD